MPRSLPKNSKSVFCQNRTFYKMADETDQNTGENDENTTFKDLVSVKLKFFFILIG